MAQLLFYCRAQQCYWKYDTTARLHMWLLEIGKTQNLGTLGFFNVVSSA